MLNQYAGLTKYLTLCGMRRGGGENGVRSKNSIVVKEEGKKTRNFVSGACMLSIQNVMIQEGKEIGNIVTGA